MNGNFYVYAYTRLDSNTYFYIGKGSNNRWKRTDLRSNHFKNILNKTECAVEILYDNLTEEESFKLEFETIDYLLNYEGYTIEFDKIKNKGFNHLVNCTLGGEGISGFKHSDDTVIKCTHYGESNGMFGKKGELYPHYGKTFSQEHKNKIMISNTNRKDVYCVELNKSFKSYREAERVLLNDYNIVCSHASISSICRGKSQCGGHYKDSSIKAKLHFYNI